jgi:hypothetical protein
VAQANRRGTAQVTPVWIPPPLKTIYTGMVAPGSIPFEKGECKAAEGGDSSFRRLNEPIFLPDSGGDPAQEIPKVSKGSEVSSQAYTLGTCRHWAW